MNTARRSLLQTTISCSSNSNSISRSKRAAEKRLDRDEALGRGANEKFRPPPLPGAAPLSRWRPEDRAALGNFVLLAAAVRLKLHSGKFDGLLA
jgi:hypothetical protein